MEGTMAQVNTKCEKVDTSTLTTNQPISLKDLRDLVESCEQFPGTARVNFKAGQAAYMPTEISVIAQEPLPEPEEPTLPAS